MSGRQVHLTPPVDHSNSVLALVVGVSIALVVFSITRNTSPHVGDNIHSLPHGGCYKDGTKSIYYGKPGNSVRQPARGAALVLVIFLPILIYAIHKFESRRTRVSACGHIACPSGGATQH
ncbi:tgb2 [Tamus red mosaic virus]|uniref:Tgb2 n=1 Tax=Tamus red mosaic virus TaxID=1081702 RepID=G3LHV6_9VIRU|nr:tgb2 [Tamus red mosaic virus]AEO12142.1 tgb2 [Tamus red mosaic virus]